MKKIAALLSAVIFISSVAGAAGIPYGSREANPALSLPENPHGKMENGTLVLEAEDMTIDDHMKVVNDDNASGGRAIVVSVGPVASNLDQVTPNPNFYIEMDVQETGNYMVWVRVKTPDNGSDSVWYSLNTDVYQIYSFDADNRNSGNKYYWVNLGTLSMTPGKRHISFKYRELNFSMDKLIVTSNLSFEPTGKDDVPEITDEVQKLDIYPDPDIKPIAEHPRLFLTKDYIPHLLHNVETEELAPLYKVTSDYADEELDAEVESTSGTYSPMIETKLQARAFMYVLGKRDAEHAKKTLEYTKDYLTDVSYPSAQDITRAVGNTMIMGAMVYDWCYDVLTDEDKKEFNLLFRKLASMKEIGYPPTKMSSIGAHSGEYEIMRDLIGVGIAIYDEDPEIYDVSAGRFFSEYIESRKLFNKSGNHPQGSSYGSFRFGCELYAEIIFGRMGYENVLGEGIETVSYKWMYERTPFGAWFKDGDDAVMPKQKYFQYSEHDRMEILMASNYFKDPYLRRQYLKLMSIHDYVMENIWLLLLAEPDVGMKEQNDLPLARKTKYPLSSVTARTSWQTGVDAPTAMAHMKIQERNLGDHMHPDSGAFQLYYKGSLAIQSGIYEGQDGVHGSEYYKNYYRRSSASNTISVYDPNDPEYNDPLSSVRTNDGGQLINSHYYGANTYEELMSDVSVTAESKGTYIGPNEYTPKFSYIGGDLTKAYSAKVKDYDRRMVFMDLFDEDYPAAFVVFDRVNASNKSFKKTWLLHSIEEPVINGNVTTICRTESGFNGKLVNTTLLPAQSKIEKVGGEGMEYTVNGVNYVNRDYEGMDTEGGKWRVEVSPARENETDIFLNAMYMTDADRDLPRLEMNEVQNSVMTGVSVKDRLVMFSSTAQPISRSFSLNVPETGYDTVSCMLADITPGTWKVSGEGTEIVVEVKDDESVIYFEGKPGNYNIAPANNAAVTEISYPSVEKAPLGDFLIYENGLFLNQPTPTKEIDGVPYAAIRGMIEKYGAEIGWDDATGTVTIASDFGGTVEFVNGTGVYTLNGEEHEAEHTPMLINGSTYICISDFEDVLKIKTKYDSYAKILHISITDRDILKFINDATVYAPVEVTASDNDGNAPTNTADYNLTTRWSAEGTSHWLLYNLGEPVEIGKILLATYRGKARSLSFEVEVSTDGRSFNRVYTGATSGTTEDLESFSFTPVTAQYVRFVGHGTTTDLWNSVTELVVAR